MRLNRVLEPEVMDSEDAARADDAMDHSAVSRSFCDDLVTLGPDVERIRDVGTGTGRTPIELCRRSMPARVLGVDLATAMIDVDPRHVEEAGIASLIQLEQADAKRLPYKEGTLSTVASNRLIHHVPDPAPVFIAPASMRKEESTRRADAARLAGLPREPSGLHHSSESERRGLRGVLRTVA